MLARLKITILMATLFVLSFFTLELLATSMVGTRFTVKQMDPRTANDLHFSAHQKETSGVWITAAMIDVRGLGTARIDGFVVESTTRGLPDGRIHGYNVDAVGSIPRYQDVEIDVEFTLNRWNTVRIDGGYWTYPTGGPRTIPNSGFKVKRRWSGSGESLQDDQEMIYIFHNDDSTYECVVNELQFYLAGDSITLDSLQNWTNWQTIGNYPQWIGPLDSLIVPMDTIPVGKFLYFRSEFEFITWDATATATFSAVGYHEEQETRPSAWMGCDALTPIFCRGKDFYFKLGVANHTGLTLTGILTFAGYANYDCDPIYSLINIRRAKSYSPGLTETYYYFSVPNAVQAGRYSAGVSGSLSDGLGNYYPMSCCMNIDIIQCGPFRTGENTEWELIEVDRQEVEAALPTVTSLAQNYPNPFNEETNITYNLAEAGNVTVKVYDISGRLVGTLVEGYQEAGAHVVSWDASEVSSGVYFYKLTCGDYSATKKMNLLK